MDRSAVINEIKFARGFSSFWRQTTPMMEGFIRGLNHGAYERDFVPMKTRTAATRRAFVNQIAFTAFAEKVDASRRRAAYSIGGAIRAAGSTLRPFDASGTEAASAFQLSEEEIEDAEQQIRRLWGRLEVDKRLPKVHCCPAFYGCGIVDACEGDVVGEDTLYEIKAGDRQIRAIDFRQILVYLALNYARESFPIRKAALVNPRVGISFEITTDDLAYAVGGRDSANLLDAITQGMSSGDISP